jgi:hypothetical protein
VVGVAKHGVEAIEAIGLLEPDVVTLDVDMPVMDGLTAVKNAGGTTLRMEYGAYAHGAPSHSLKHASAYEPVASEYELWSRIETFGRGILLDAATSYKNIKR